MVHWTREIAIDTEKQLICNILFFFLFFKNNGFVEI